MWRTFKNVAKFTHNMQEFFEVWKTNAAILFSDIDYELYNISNTRIKC